MGVVYSVLIPKVKETQSINQKIIEKKIEIETELKELEEKSISTKLNLDSVEEKLNYLKKSYQEKYEEYHSLREDCEKESRRAEDSAQKYYDKMMEIQKKKLEYDLKNEKKKYDDAIDEYKQEYSIALSEAANEFQKEIIQKNIELSSLNNTLEHEKAIVSAAVEANKRAFEMEEKENFYRLNLSENDITEIKELRECLKHLRNPEPLNKVIWKTYYEKPYSDLVGRVIGSGVHCGIYKITNLNNKMCYVGQAVDIASRWRQHIKRGLGAEAPTRNKLYPIMLSIGVENFSFEIIEECSREQLNEKENYWQEYFKAKEFGYSIK